MLGFIFTIVFTFSQALAGLGQAALGAEEAPTETAAAFATETPAPIPPVPAPPVTSPPPAPIEPAPEAAAPASPTPTSKVGAVVSDLSFFALPLPAKAGGLNADQVVKEVQGFYKQTRRLRAKFRQTVHDPVFGRDTTSEGWVYIKKPGKMRWDYYGKATRTKPQRRTKSFISDGQTLWAIHHDDKTAIKKSLQQNLLPVAVTFLYGKGNLSRDFHAVLDTSGKYGRKSDHVLKLTPKQPSAQYKHLWLVVDPENFRVKQSIVLNAKGETNAFRFYEPNTKKPIPNKYFVFNMGAAKRAGYREVKVGKNP